LLFHYICYILIHIVHLIMPIGCNIKKRVCMYEFVEQIGYKSGVRG